MHTPGRNSCVRFLGGRFVEGFSATSSNLRHVIVSLILSINCSSRLNSFSSFDGGVEPPGASAPGSRIRVRTSNSSVPPVSLPVDGRSASIRSSREGRRPVSIRLEMSPYRRLPNFERMFDREVASERLMSRRNLTIQVSRAADAVAVRHGASKLVRIPSSSDRFLLKFLEVGPWNEA